MQYGGKYNTSSRCYNQSGACSKLVTYFAQQISTKVIVHDPCINPAPIILQKY